MKKTIKIVSITLGSLVALILLAVTLIPLLFKDKIKIAVDDVIKQKINVEVIYNVDDISLSIISSFPNLRFGIDNLTVKNYAPFTGDTLAYIGSFHVDFALWKFITDGEIKVNKLALHAPYFNLKINAAGISNYDIVKSDSTQKKDTTTTKSGPFDFALDKWEITKARIYYHDSTSRTYVMIDNFSQIGSANIKSGITSANIKTDIPSITASYGKVDYLKKHRFSSMIDIDITENYTLFTLRKNEIKLNDFAFFSKGFLKMKDSSVYNMDITFASNTNSFKSVLSLVPAVYTKSFNDIQTNGQFNFSGFVKGLYDKHKNQIPAFEFVLKVMDGYFKYPSLNLPMEKIQLYAKATNDGSNVKNTNILIDNFSLEIAKDPIRIKGALQKLNDYWIEVIGRLNLDNLQKVYPMESLTIAGILDLQLKSSGKLDNILKRQYQQLVNAGNLRASNVSIITKEYPKVTVSSAIVEFDATQVALQQFTSQIGKSDLVVKGKITDYLSYIFSDNGILKGNVSITSNNIDLNEFMGSDKTAPSIEKKEVAKKDSANKTPSKPYIIPKNWDLTLNSSITKLSVLDMDITNFGGQITVKDGILKLNQTKLNMLAGSIIAKGTYNTANPAKPKVDFDLDMKNISLKQAYQTFGIVKKLAPIAEKIEGTASLVIDIASELGDSYLPIAKTLNGKGKFNLNGAGLKDFELLNQVASVTNLQAFKDPTLQQTTISFEIKEGKLSTDPFAFNVGGVSSKVSGYTTIDGFADYVVETKIPAKEAGKYVQNLVGSDLGGLISQVKEIPVNIYFKGKYNQIKPSLVPDKQQLMNSVKSQAKQVVQQKTEEVKKIAVDEGKKTVEKLLDPNDKRSTGEKLNSAVDEGKKKLLNLFGKPK